MNFNNCDKFITDGAYYNITTFTLLSELNEKIIHIKCISHGIQILCNTIMKYMDQIHILTQNISKIFHVGNSKKRKIDFKIYCIENDYPSHIPIKPINIR